MSQQPPIGILEGFFGSPWSWENRHTICQFLSGFQNSFYIYAPKADPFLRKQWQDNHPQDHWTKLKTLATTCQSHRVKFGIGLSPFELPSQWPNQIQKQNLSDRLKKLSELNPDIIAIFFDDMRSEPDLAPKQIEILEFVQGLLSGRILFCPTFYCFDPILDKVFGQRPENYLEELGKNLSDRVDMIWTGEKVLSKNISAQHLQSVSQILKRKPFIWDNSFAADGPKYCKFIPIEPGNGIDDSAMGTPSPITESAGWAVNPMNLATFAPMVFLATHTTLTKSVGKSRAMEMAMQQLLTPEFATWLLANRPLFTKTGLDNISLEARDKARMELKKFQDPAAEEATRWLDGQFNVGPECLTD